MSLGDSEKETIAGRYYVLPGLRSVVSITGNREM